ncbi:aspartate/glutamate racemase family protein [Streptomyces sp. NPDC002306]
MGHPLIGILAGMGPRSTGPFVDMVVTECQRQYGARDDIDFPKMMICSQPAPFYEDRPVDHDALESAIRNGLQDLERAGADLLAIACNTAHVYYDNLAVSVKPPLLDMVSLTVEAMPADAGTVGVIAAHPTMESGIYQRALAGRGFSVADVGWQDKVDELLGKTRTSASADELAVLWQEIDGLLCEEGVETVVVACLDLSAVSRHATTDLSIVDAAQCLATNIVRQWLRLR